MNRKTLIVLVVIIFGGIPMAIFIYNRSTAKRTAARKINCEQQLRHISSVLQTYKEMNGSFPPSLSTIDKDYRLMQCPSRSFNQGYRDESYNYINWTIILGNQNVPEGYPLLYDKYLTNHENGIFILRTDGAVIWDESLKWLTEFKERNPAANVPMPVVTP